MTEKCDADSPGQDVGRARPGAEEGAAGHPDSLHWNSPLRIQHGLLCCRSPRYEGGDEVGTDFFIAQSLKHFWSRGNYSHSVIPGIQATGEQLSWFGQFPVTARD